jgi:anti-anti-sigma factor
MKFQIDKRDRLVIVKLNEEKLLSNLALQLKSELVILNNEGFRNIVLDLADVQYVDSSGLSALLVGNRLCKETRRNLCSYRTKRPYTKVDKDIATGADSEYCTYHQRICRFCNDGGT